MKPYRNQRLRDLAQEAPYCMYCKATNNGQVVLAHSNHIRHGKGMGTKAHDIPCYLCASCHDILDGRLKQTDVDTPLRIQMEGTYNSFLWLLQEGYLK